MALERASFRGLGRQLFDAPGPRLHLLRAYWSQAVGKDLARRTELVSVEGQVLRIRVPDARWRKALHRMQREILSRLAAAAGELAPRRLGFVEGPIEEAPEPARTVPGPAPARELQAEVAAGAEAIADPEIRELFKAAAARYLNARS